MYGKGGRDAIAFLGLPACDGRRCLAHAGVVKILLPVTTIPFGAPSVHQRSTDFAARFALAGVSVSVLQGVPCAPQFAAASLRRGSKGVEWPTP
jgi:hypothetical protein